MGAAADLALLTLDPESGKNLLGIAESDAVFGGAVLVDLADRGAVEISGSGKKARVRLVGVPTGDAALAGAAGRLKPNANPKASSVVARLGKNVRAGLLDQLMVEGIVRAREQRVLGVFPVTRHTVVDAARRRTLVRAVSSVLTHGAEPDEATAALIALLTVGGVVKQLIPPPERKAALRRAKKIADGQWSGAASKAAIDAASAAVAAAMTASIVATSSAANN